MPQQITTVTCSACSKTITGLALASMSEQKSPQCPNCRVALNPIQVQAAANITQDERSGLMILPVVLISWASLIGVAVGLSYASPVIREIVGPIIALMMAIVAIVSSAVYRQKNGSAFVCCFTALFFGPLAALFLAWRGPWKTDNRNQSSSIVIRPGSRFSSSHRLDLVGRRS